MSRVFDVYAEAYERRYRRKLQGKENRITVMRNLRELVLRVGEEEAVQAVRAILGDPKLKWVSSSHDAFLASDKNYERHVVPVLLAAPAGEQSEWTGDRGGEACRAVSFSDLARTK